MAQLSIEHNMKHVTWKECAEEIFQSYKLLFL